ncbi:unnamed protein product, partial [Prunus brigantina]
MKMYSFANLFSSNFHLNIAHYFLLFFLASLFPHTTKLCFGDALPSVTPCIDEERRALLAFKQDLTDPSGRLSSWAGQHCCQWKGISCNNKTGHVEMMNLGNTYTYTLSVFDAESDEMEHSSLGGKINPSLLGLKHLNYLDLSQNDFHGIPIPKFFGQLKSLRYLNLSYASFGGEIPPQFGNLSNLNYLDLSEESDYSLLELPSNNLNWLSNLSSLKYLNLEGLGLNKTGESWLHAVNMLPSLLELYLPACQIESLPLSLGNISLKSLLILDMSYNDVKFPFPEWLLNLAKLRKLDLRGNSFSGAFPLELGRLKSLEHLDLSFNALEGQIPKLAGNFCKLKILNLASNKFDGGIQDLLSGLTSCLNTNLESLDLSSNMLQREPLCNLGYLHILDLAHNNFSGTIPKCLNHLSALTHGNSSAYDLYSYYDQQTSVVKVTELEYQRQTLMLVKSIDLSSNSLEGEIPEEICSLLLLHSLNLSENQLNGNIPSNIGSLQLLEVLDLSRNRLSGWIPQSLSSSTFLSHLNLSYNNLTGRIPL